MADTLWGPDGGGHIGRHRHPKATTREGTVPLTQHLFCAVTVALTGAASVCAVPDGAVGFDEVTEVQTTVDMRLPAVQPVE